MLAILRKTCPYPTIDPDGRLEDGLSIKQPPRCRKCVTKSCRDLFSRTASAATSHAVCEFGYSLIAVPTSYGMLFINGVFVPFQNIVMDAPTKKQNRSQKVPWEEALAFSQALAIATPTIDQEVQRHAQDAVAGLHDIKTGVSVVFRNAEAIVSSLSGMNDYERIESAPPPLKALLKSVNLLSSRLSLASLVANPQAARYGQRRRTPVYRVFHLMVRLFEQEAAKKHIALKMAGSSTNTLWLYDSFETLPLVLIDNAIKYSTGTKDIVVRFADSGSNACRASVESWGPIVQPEHRQRIFERGFRTEEAMHITSSGSGLGLYIAKIVADANGCELTYTATPRQNTDIEGINTFSLSVRDAPES